MADLARISDLWRFSTPYRAAANALKNTVGVVDHGARESERERESTRARARERESEREVYMDTQE